MRRLLVGTCAAVALAVPASAVAWEIGNAPGTSYDGLTAVDTDAHLRMLATKYVSSGGPNPIYHCSYYVVVEYKPVLHAYRYEFTLRSGSARDSVGVNVSTSGGDDGAPGMAFADPNSGASYTPAQGYRIYGSSSIGYVTRGDVTVGTNESCATDPTQGGQHELIRMAGFVDSSLAPTPTPTATPIPTALPTLLPTATPPAGTPAPTATPAPALELLPPAADATARLQSTVGKDGTTPVVTVTRDGKTYRADESSTFQVGDVIKVGPKTLLALEYTIGGRTSLGPGAEVRIAGDRQLELLGGTTEVGPVDHRPLEIQTNGGTMGIRG